MGITTRFYANKTVTTYRNKGGYKNYHLLTEEEKKAKNKKNALNQKKKRFRELCYSCDEEFKYLLTFTSGISEERSDASLLKKEVNKYLNKQNCKYVCVIQRNKSLDEYHIHSLCTKKIDMEEWSSQHRCSSKALYIGKIKDTNKAVNYIARDLGNLPPKMKSSFANYDRKKSASIITNENGNIIYKSPNCHLGTHYTFLDILLFKINRCARFVKIRFWDKSLHILIKKCRAIIKYYFNSASESKDREVK